MLRVVTLGALVVAIVFVASLIFKGDSGYKYSFDFQSASGMVTGNFVMVGGSPIGKVTSVELTENNRVKMDVARVQEWIAKGAQPTDRVVRFLEAAGVVAKTQRSNPKKAVPGKKAQERAKERAEKAAAASAE